MISFSHKFGGGLSPGFLHFTISDGKNKREREILCSGEIWYIIGKKPGGRRENMEKSDTIQARLAQLADPTYRDFQCRLMPTVDPGRVLGVRTPDLRALARELIKTGEGEAFLAQLPHVYYEENNLHGLLIGAMKDFDQTVAALDGFLPYVDNWATCDLLRPKLFQKHRRELLGHIRRWLGSRETYTLRFAVEMLMVHYLDEDFCPAYLDWVADLRSEEYYVNMMVAWYFATALDKRYREALPYVEGERLTEWTRRKAIQKALESYRVPEERKAYLRTLRQRGK
jgi:3-methyladenine DNA glycosylase AlkD